MVFEVFGYTQETEIVATIEDFVGVLCLFGRKSAIEIIINSCQCLGLIHIEFDGIEQPVAIPTFRTCLLCVEKHCCIIITNSLKKSQYMTPRQKCDSLSHFYCAPPNLTVPLLVERRCVVKTARPGRSRSSQHSGRSALPLA